MPGQTRAKDELDPKALACYGLLVACPAALETLPEHRPVRPVIPRSLAWCCHKLEKLGKTALLLIWDNASWHISKEVRPWVRTHNRQVRLQGKGGRIIACSLPGKSP